MYPSFSKVTKHSSVPMWRRTSTILETDSSPRDGPRMNKSGDYHPKFQSNRQRGPWRGIGIQCRGRAPAAEIWAGGKSVKGSGDGNEFAAENGEADEGMLFRCYDFETLLISRIDRLDSPLSTDIHHRNNHIPFQESS